MPAGTPCLRKVSMGPRAAGELTEKANMNDGILHGDVSSLN